jgi:hypothetical protein
MMNFYSRSLETMRRSALFLFLGVTLTGCARQTLTVTSEPAGAVVYLNDVEFGRTPVSRPFTWYGTYDVQLRREGYQALDTRGTVIAPWWNWVPIDLVAALFPLHDRQRLHYTLTPATTQPGDDLRLAERARQLATELPATQPAR